MKTVKNRFSEKEIGPGINISVLKVLQIRNFLIFAAPYWGVSNN